MSWIRKWAKKGFREDVRLNAMAEHYAKAANRYLGKDHLAWWRNREWLKPYAKFIEDDRLLDRRFTLIEWARSVKGLAGSTAECGVLRGTGSALICKTLEGTYTGGARHLGFDSFEGLPEPRAEDRVTAKDGPKVLEWKQGHLATPKEIAAATLKEFDFCELHQGWIPDCLTPARDRRFRLVHIDVDLYEPTLQCLDFFYPRMVQGGVFFFDDYGSMSCPGARQAIDEFFAGKPEAIVEMTTCQAIAIKR